MNEKHGIYLIVVYGDVEPEIFGPFNDENERDNKALSIRQADGEEHGIFMLSVHKPTGRPSVEAYSGGFFEEERRAQHVFAKNS